MAVPFSNTKLRVPKGFQNILEALAREVLRVQPENIYNFSAAYFEELLRMKQETGYDDIALLGAKLEDRFYNNHAFKNIDSNANNEEQEDAAVKIQSEYRRFAAKKEVGTLKEEEAATKIQASFRGHLERKRLKDSQSNSVTPTESEQIIQTNENAGDDQETQDTARDDDEVIQSIPDVPSESPKEGTPEVSMSHTDENAEPKADDTAQQTRDEDDMTDKDAVEAPTQDFDMDLEDPDLNKAATKIQANFKGFKTRKELNKEPTVTDDNTARTAEETDVEPTNRSENAEDTA